MTICATPGTVYETEFTPSRIVLTIELPLPMLGSLGGARERHLVRSFHHAILPVVEGIFQEHWEKVIAGREIGGTSMPAQWAELFE